jgi:predicted Zn finger-like uncharacterized protein
MITHCPSCHTHFRVHADQLAARAGQVRCGKCSQVFDALEYLIEEAAQAAAPAAPHASDAAPAPALEKDADAESAAMQAVGAMSAPLPELAPEQPASVDPGVAPGFAEFDFGPRAGASPAAPARRWPWLLGALLLLLVLLAQAAYYYRSAVIVLVPQVKPYAIALCATIGCELPLPRRIEMMSIEASDLQADTTNPNIMVLSATLKNRAIFDQQLPLLELTLTDAQDQAVVRRVLAPQDYIGKNANVAAGFAANSEIAIKVYIEGSQVKATGYRLYLFYP